jgi:hypothetical protein
LPNRKIVIAAGEFASRPVPEMNLCRDCRWAKGLEGLVTEQPYDYVCQHSTSVRMSLPDYVLGRPQEPRQLQCRIARDDPARCGPEGRYWEAKDGSNDATTLT